LKFEVNAPEDAFLGPADADSVKVMFVAENSDDQPPGYPEPCYFFSDRQVQVYLNELTPSGELKIATKVGDFDIPLGVGGLRNTRVRILAKVTFGNSERGERKDVPIILQADPPVLNKAIVLEPEATVPAGQSIHGYVTVEKWYSPIKEIQIGVDRNDSGSLEETDKPEKLIRPDDGKWRFTLPTEGLPPRGYTLIAKATDSLGMTSKAITRNVTLDKPATHIIPPTTSTISGTITDQEGRPVNGADITLRGTNFTTQSDASGKFTIKDVPHGTYKLEARGVVIGSYRSAKEDIVLPGPSEPLTVHIKLMW